MTGSGSVRLVQVHKINGFEDSGFAAEGAESADFKPLTREEAAALKGRVVSVSLASVLLWQAVAGVSVAVVAWLWAGSSSAGFSALYGSLSVLVPGVVFARGLSRRLAAGKLGMSGSSGAALVGFFVWEMVKVVLTVAMLAAAPRVVVHLDWLALLAGFVVTMKVYWVAAWLGLGSRRAIKKMG
jgi:ATP synthase protein I